MTTTEQPTAIDREKLMGFVFAPRRPVRQLV